MGDCNLIRVCRECKNTSFNYVDFTSKSVCECEQCGERYYLDERDKIEDVDKE